MALCSRQKGELAWIGGGEGLVRGERRRVLVGCDRGQRRERGVERARPRDPQEGRWRSRSQGHSTLAGVPGHTV